MIFLPTPLQGAYLIQPELKEDDRGFYARAYCAQEFAEHDLCTDFKQANIAFNKTRGITRGMHYQKEPDAEVKLVRCTSGSVFDAIVDMRPDSPTYKQWYGTVLSAENRHQLYVPTGFAHGYQVLEDNSEFSYMTSAFYAPQSEAGVRWDDAAVGIVWPIKDNVQLSVKDQSWLLLD